MRAASRHRGQVTIVLAVAVAVAGCAGAGSEPSANAGGELGAAETAGGLEDMEPVTITVADVTPDSTYVADAYRAMIDYVEEETGGKITFEAYFSGSLMGAEELLHGLETGVADMGQIITNYYPQDLPAADYLNQMGSLLDTSFPLGQIQGSVATTLMYQRSPAVVAEFEEHNLKALTASSLHRIPMLCKGPLGTPEEAAGTRVRTSGPIAGDEVEQLGMVPVPVPVLDLYEGLQRGVVDCSALDAGNSVDYSLWEVATYLYPVDMSGVPGNTLAINLETWDSLPPEAQQIMLEGSAVFWSVKLEGLLDRYVQFGTVGAEEHGVTFEDSRPFDEMLHGFQEENLIDLVQNAPPGVKDPQGFIDDYKALLDEAEAQLIELGVPSDVPKDPESVAESYRTAGEVDLDSITAQLLEELSG